MPRNRRRRAGPHESKHSSGPASPRRNHTGPIEKLSLNAAKWTGSSAAFAIAVAFVVGWALTGPWLKFSNTWQLMANTVTTIVTFFMVFLIQRAQNKDTRAVELKLNELIAAMPGASNHLINLEDLSEEELDTLHRHFGRLAEMAKRDKVITESHSVEMAMKRHAQKPAG